MAEASEEGFHDRIEDLTRSLDLLRSLQADLDLFRSSNVIRPISESLSRNIGVSSLNTISYTDSIAKILVDNQRLAADALRNALGFSEHFAEQWRKSLSLQTLNFYPKNLRDATPSRREFEALMLDEGIPLMWVPGPQVVRALLDATDAPARRRIIGRRWRGISYDCEAVIADITHPALNDAHTFALVCISALRTGHTAPAQALAANLLDSLLRIHLNDADRKKLTSNKKDKDKFDLNSYGANVALTFAPVWSAHAEYWPKEGDPIPRTFGRHPSAHGVSRNQYSRINAVIAIMLVTSILKLLDVELER